MWTLYAHDDVGNAVKMQFETQSAATMMADTLRADGFGYCRIYRDDE